MLVEVKMIQTEPRIFAEVNYVSDEERTDILPNGAGSKNDGIVHEGKK